MNVNVICAIAANCSIDIQAYGGHYDLNLAGFVKLNNVTVWRSSVRGPAPNLRGVNILLIEPLKCSVQESRNFDTYAYRASTRELSTYLQQVRSGGVIVGVTADDPTANLAYALPALHQLGVDVYDVQYRGAFAFVAQQGSPAKTVLRKTWTDSVADQPRLTVNITGIIQNKLLPDRTNGRAYATVLRPSVCLSVVCNVA